MEPGVGRRLLVLVVLAALVAPALPPDVAPGSLAADGDGGRGTWTVRAFMETATPVSVLFEDSAVNTTYHLQVPRGCTVVSATVALSGEERYSLKGTPTDFGDNPNASHSGYWDEEGTYPPSGTPTNYRTNVLAMEDEPDLATLDGTVYSTSTSWNNNPPPHTRPYHLFDMRIDCSDMVRLGLEWQGYGENQENDTFTHTSSLWVYNYVTTKWDGLGSYSRNDPTPVVTRLGRTLKSPYDYASATGHVYVLAFGQEDETLGGWPSVGSVSSDYVSATVLRNDTLVLPQDVSLGVDNGTPVWTHPGGLSGEFTIGVGEDLAGALQAWVDAQGPGPGTLSVPITLRASAATMGAVRVTSIAVQVREADNKPPAFLGAQEVTMEEDVDLPEAIDLWDHFEDELEGDDLTYAVAYEENASALHAVIADDGHHVDIYTTAPDWAGALAFRFSAADSWNLTTVSTDFTVTVEEVNDPPAIATVGTQYLQEDVPYELNLTATDPDIPYGDTLAWTDDTDMFEVDASGRIAFTPLQEQVGRHDVNVTVTDARGASARVKLTLYISESNDPPFIVDPGPLEAREDELFSYNFTVIDPDGGETVLWTLVGGKGTMFLGKQNGRLTWVPTTEEVGTHDISVIATDKRGASFQRNVTLVVLNVNDPPELSAPSRARLTEGERFQFALTFSDPDFGVDPDEAVAFTVEPALFAITPNGTVDFTPTNDDVGTHWLNVTITDAAGGSMTVPWEVDVANVNQPPVVLPVPAQTWREDERVTLWICATDPDAGDSLAFLDSTSMFTIDLATGLIDFVPRQADVGVQDVTIRVHDRDGAEARVTFTVSVMEVNDPPIVSIRADPANVTLREGDELSLAADASDEDDEREELEFAWTLDGKEVGKGDSLVLRKLRPGLHAVTVTVSDGASNATASYQFQVKAAEEGAPVMLIVSVVAAAAVAAVVVYMLVKPRLRRPVKARPEEGPKADAGPPMA
jgi:hypothetical protein